MAWLWVARTLGGQVGKRIVKQRSKKWAAKQVKKRGGKLFPPPTAPFHMIPKGKGKTKSKRGPGSAVKKTGRPKSRKTMRARSAPRSKMVRYRKGGCPPGYRYDPRRKMCIQINYK